MVAKVNVFVEIPEGRVRVGLSSETAERLSVGSGEEFLHLATDEIFVARFLIQIHPVTCEEYYEFLERNLTIERPYYLESGLPQHLKRKPVTAITWFEAKAYARFIGARLPTEYELEKAFSLAAQDVPAQAKPRRNLPDVGRNPGTSNQFHLLDTLGVIDHWTATKHGSHVISKGAGYNSKIRHPARRYLLRPSDRWMITGFRCAKTR